jgi:hypothetical protein
MNAHRNRDLAVALDLTCLASLDETARLIGR